MAMDKTQLSAFASSGQEPREYPDEDIATEAEMEGEDLDEEVGEHFSPDQLERLTSPEVNYMELSEEAGAFSCGNCQWAGQDGNCSHPKVDAPVSPTHGCCNLFSPSSGPPAFPPDWQAPE